jgi:hypothetical protein
MLGRASMTGCVLAPRNLTEWGALETTHCLSGEKLPTAAQHFWNLTEVEAFYEPVLLQYSGQVQANLAAYRFEDDKSWMEVEVV